MTNKVAKPVITSNELRPEFSGLVAMPGHLTAKRPPDIRWPSRVFLHAQRDGLAQHGHAAAVLSPCTWV